MNLQEIVNNPTGRHVAEQLASRQYIKNDSISAAVRGGVRHQISDMVYAALFDNRKYMLCMSDIEEELTEDEDTYKVFRILTVMLADPRDAKVGEYAYISPYAPPMNDHPAKLAIRISDTEIREFHQDQIGWKRTL